MEILSPLEASLDHLLVTPPSHFTPQKAEGFVVGLITYRGNNYPYPENTLNLMGSQGENCLLKLLYFSGQNCGFRFELLYSEGKC